MVLRYWGERGLTAESFASLVDRSASGIRTTALVGELSRRGWSTTAAEGTGDLLRGEIDAGRPVIALIQDRPGTLHYVVVVAIQPDAIVYHDPARGPLRVVAREAWDQRWAAADRWMAVVLPPASRAEPPAPATLPDLAGAAATTCDEQRRSGIAAALGHDIERADRVLTAALACPGVDIRRELAGVRVLQQRWNEAAVLAETVLAAEPADDYSWRVLATARFVQGRQAEALAAWNHVGEPRLDLIRIEGLERTRPRPVERLIGIASGTRIQSGAFARAARSLRDLPSAASTRLELAPPAQGVADLRAEIVERPRVPHDAWSLAAIGADAAIARTIDVTLGSLSGGGESIALEWRFWPQRPRVAGAFRAPAPWSGTWGVDAYGESQEFVGAIPRLTRRGGRLVAVRWLTAGLRLDVHGGGDRWSGAADRAFASGGTTLTMVSGEERLVVRTSVDGWSGASRFSAVGVTAMGTTAGRTAAPHVALTGTATATGVTTDAPFDLWPAGDTGQARTFLLRAHPVLDGGRLRLDRVGRGLLQASGEAQRWWSAPALSRIGAAVFVDAATTRRRPGGLATVNDVDVGVGVRLGSGFAPGRVSLDFAHGLRDGANVFSARYIAGWW